MFKNTDTKLEVEYFELNKYPRIIFPIKTLAIMKFIVDTVPEEVGWLGYVEERGDDLIVTDIYIPGQHVHGATCELDEGESLTKVCLQVVEEGKDPSKVKFWAHSHGNGGVSPSGQDKIQSMSLLKDFGDYMIRAICNKSGTMSVAYYDNKNKRIIENVQWYMNDGVNHKEIADYFGPIIKENVKQFTYTENHNNCGQGWTEHNYGRGAYSPDEVSKCTSNSIKRLFNEKAKRISGKVNFSLVGGGK